MGGNTRNHDDEPRRRINSMTREIERYLNQARSGDLDAAFRGMIGLRGDVITALQEAYHSDSDLKIRWFILECVWNRRLTSTIDFLAVALRDPDPILRGSAIDKLVALSSPESRTALKGALDHAAGTDATCRDRLIDAIGQVDMAIAHSEAGLIGLCLECGEFRVVPIIWNSGRTLYEIDLTRLDGTRAIAGGRNRPENVPDRVCLSCQPAWSEVHRIALQEVECEGKMEAAISAQEFATAAAWRDKKLALQKRKQEVLTRLLSQ